MSASLSASHSSNTEDTTNFFIELLSADESLTSSEITVINQNFNTLLVKVKHLKSKSKTDQEFLQRLFYKTHRILKHYKTNATFTDIFLKGEYDCVTSSALYGLLLKALGYKFQIYEFPYHVAIEITTNQKSYFIDPTDPISGFLTESDLIIDRVESYKTDFGKMDSRDNALKLIDLKSLIGLQYYNLSVDSFNSKNYVKSRKLLQEAHRFYPSERIKELSRYIAISE
jgi:hypothetical protein